jgi:uncharacterized protein YndB with AHSA1/START domain
MTDFPATAAVDVAAPPERVWQALTDPEEIAAYMMGSQVETTWEVGSPITWNGEWEGKAYQDKGEVLEFAPPQRLVVTHYSPMTGQDDVPENYHRVQYDLTPTTAGTRLELTQDGNESPAQAEEFSATWQGMLDGLKRTVEGR